MTHRCSSPSGKSYCWPWSAGQLGPRDALSFVVFVLMMAGLYGVFVYAPTEREMGIVQKIFYFHLPLAWVSFVAFFLVFVSSILYLWTGKGLWDMLACSSAEIGLLFCGLVLLTGSIWGRPIWNTWWTWDPRLTTALILWLMYFVYMMLRSMAGGERGARYAAVFGIVGFMDVPIVYLSVRWWRSIHPVVIRSRDVGLAPPMLLTLVVCLASFLLLFAYLLIIRFRLEQARDELSAIRETRRTSPRP